MRIQHETHDIYGQSYGYSKDRVTGQSSAGHHTTREGETRGNTHGQKGHGLFPRLVLSRQLLHPWWGPQTWSEKTAKCPHPYILETVTPTAGPQQRGQRSQVGRRISS